MPDPAPIPLIDWLTGQCWPLWRDHGFDAARRGFHESLDPADLTCPAGFRRLRVLTRQIYVWSGAAPLALQGIDRLDHAARAPDGGYEWRFDLNHQPIDHRRDLYDHAFCLLAWASAAPLLPEGLAQTRAMALDDYLDRNFRHPHGGFREAWPEADEPRRQNPHMHLFEACLAAAENFASAHFFARAHELADLFLRRLFQPAEAALPEYFAPDLTPLRDAGRFVVEPGHLAEWIWLIDWYQRLAPRCGVSPDPALAGSSAALAQTLDRPACRNPLGALIDELWSDGSVRSGNARLWPQTERLKAEWLRPDRSAAKIAQSQQALWGFIAGARPGLWHERWDAGQGFLPGPAPASSVYHLTAGILVARGE